MWQRRLTDHLLKHESSDSDQTKLYIWAKKLTVLILEWVQ